MEGYKITKEKIEFKITCKECGEEAFLYEVDGGEYDFQHKIQCKCGNNEEIIGVDG